MEKKIRKLKDKAMSYSRDGDIDDAVETLKEVLKLDRSDLDTRKRVGDLLRRQGKTEEAIEYYQAVVGGYAAAGRLAKAMAMAKVILQMDPKHQETQRVLSELYARKTSKSGPAVLPSAMAASLTDSVKRSGTLIRGRRASKINLPAYSARAAKQADIRSKSDAMEQSATQDQTVGVTSFSQVSEESLELDLDHGTGANKTFSVNDYLSAGPPTSHSAPSVPASPSEPDAAVTPAADRLQRTRSGSFEIDLDDEDLLAAGQNTSSAQMDKKLAETNDDIAPAVVVGKILSSEPLLGEHLHSAATSVADLNKAVEELEEKEVDSDDIVVVTDGDEIDDSLEQEVQVDDIVVVSQADAEAKAIEQEVELDDIIEEEPAFAAADEFSIDVDISPVSEVGAEEDVRIDSEFLQGPEPAEALVLMDSDGAVIDALIDKAFGEDASSPAADLRLGLDPDKLPPIPLFGELSKNAFIELLVSLDQREFAPGEVIFQMGEKGETLAVIASGRVRIEKHKGPGRPIILGRLHEGDFFGEMALLGHGERTASVIAETSVEILEIPKKALAKLVKAYPSVQHVLKRFYKEHLLGQLFKTSPLFLPFDEKTQRNLFKRFKQVKLKRGDSPLVEGQKGSGLYVLISGRCEISREVAGLRMVLAELSEGDVFGEMSLLTGEPAMATVRALSKCSLLKLGKRSFQSLIMSQPQILEMVSALSAQRQEMSADLLGETPSEQVKYML